MYCTTLYSEARKTFAVIFYDEDSYTGHAVRNNRKAEYFDSELEANNRCAELIATEGLKYLLPTPLERINCAIHDMLREYESNQTYTDCEEYRREGAVGALEDLLERVKLIEETERDRGLYVRGYKSV